MTKKRAARPPQQNDNDNPVLYDRVPSDYPAASSETSRTVQLASGGTLSLVASIDVLQLSADDRAFVFELVDRVATYEEANAPTERSGE